MNPNEIEKIQSEIARLTSEGKEAEATEYLKAQYPKLPEDLQRKLLVASYIGALQDEYQEKEDIAEIQRQGTHVVEVLEKIRDKGATQ